MSAPPLVYELRDVRKQYMDGDSGFALHIGELRIHAGERLAIVGESGSGKSTALDLLALLTRPEIHGCFRLYDRGQQRLVDVRGAWQASGSSTIAALRRNNIGYISQFGGLISALSVARNLRLPQDLRHRYDPERTRRIAERMGISRFFHRFPGQLSVGERQRVAIARALANQPAILIADEPTASLDAANAYKVMTLFTEAITESGATVILASHQQQLVEDLGYRQVNCRIDTAGDRAVTRLDG